MFCRNAVTGHAVLARMDAAATSSGFAAPVALFVEDLWLVVAALPRLGAALCAAIEVESRRWLMDCKKIFVFIVMLIGGIRLSAWGGGAATDFIPPPPGAVTWPTSPGFIRFQGQLEPRSPSQLLLLVQMPAKLTIWWHQQVPGALFISFPLVFFNLRSFLLVCFQVHLLFPSKPPLLC